ncbi:hypothetical protein EKK58_10590 [Candidatus Dependentiae bacterium]|nr:MAG: hypothetical protein EKK58_10590 [Candidatus Dependentiae bacterium]
MTDKEKKNLKVIWLPIIIILGAVMNRVRGGLLSITFCSPDDPECLKGYGRYVNPIVFGLLCGLIAQSWFIIPAAFLGMLIGQSFGWGRLVGGIVNKTKVLKYSIYLSGRGIVWTSFIAASIYYFNHNILWMIPAGALMPFGYIIGSKTASDPARAWGYGEYIFGAILWGTTFSILGFTQ